MVKRYTSISEAELKAFKNYLGIEVGYDHAPTKWDAVLTDRIARNEPMVWGFMTDDGHKIEDYGSRFIILRAPEINKQRILTAMREGCFLWEDTPIIKDVSLAGKTIAINLTEKASITFVKRGGQIAKTVTGTSGKYTVNGDEGYIRIDVERKYPAIKARAGTQPFRIRDASNINNPYVSSGNWYKGNLHCHTNISDGALSPEEAIKLYEDKGYNFLAITDHIEWDIP